MWSAFSLALRGVVHLKNNFKILKEKKKIRDYESLGAEPAKNQGSALYSQKPNFQLDGIRIRICTLLMSHWNFSKWIERIDVLICTISV